MCLKFASFYKDNIVDVQLYTLNGGQWWIVWYLCIHISACNV